MRRRATSIVALAVAIATTAATVAVAGPIVNGADGNTQSVEVGVSPKKLPKKTFAPATLKVTTVTGTTTATNGIPVPATAVTLDFDKSMKLTTKGLPTCDPSLLQSTSTETALQACGNAKIGSGTATALIPGASQVFTEPATVTAFNGVPQGGKPTVLLHTYGTSPVQTTLVLVGTVSNYNKEGYGPRLELIVPPIAGGTGALTDFQVSINKTFKSKGVKQSFISSKCATKKLKARAAFTYKDGQTLTALSTQSCTQAPEPKTKTK